MPPLPPKPPLPPAAPNAPAAPTPPLPPDVDVEGYSFEFNFDSDDMEAIWDKVNERMEEARVQIELAKKEIEVAIKNTKISKEEMEHLREEINKELNNIDLKVEDEKKHKYIIIKKEINYVHDNKEKGGAAKSETKKDKDPDARKQESTTLSESQLNLNDFKIYPNPNNGSFDLQFNLAIRGTTNISVIDANGKEVFSESLADFTGAYNKHIDLPAKGKGTYLLNVKQNDKWMHKKVIVK